MRLPIFALSVSTLLGNGGNCANSGRPFCVFAPARGGDHRRSAALSRGSRDVDAAPGDRHSTPFSGQSFRNSLARRAVTDRPSAPGAIHRHIKWGSPVSASNQRIAARAEASMFSSLQTLSRA